LSKVTIAWCSILSNAFSKSNFRTTISFFLSVDKVVDIQMTRLGNPELFFV